MLLRILCVHIETSSLWAVIVNKKWCLRVTLLSEEDKIFHFDHFDNSHDSFLWLEYFIDFLCENGSHVRHWHPPRVYFTAQRQSDSSLQFKKCVKCSRGCFLEFLVTSPLERYLTELQHFPLNFYQINNMEDEGKQFWFLK